MFAKLKEFVQDSATESSSSDDQPWLKPLTEAQVQSSAPREPKSTFIPFDAQDLPVGLIEDSNPDQQMAQYAGLIDSDALVSEPLIDPYAPHDDDEAFTEVITSERPIHRRPGIKLVTLGTLTLVLMLLVGIALSGVLEHVSTEISTEETEGRDRPPPPFPVPDPSGETAEAMKVKVALGTQQRELADLNRQSKEPKAQDQPSQPHPKPPQPPARRTVPLHPARPVPAPARPARPAVASRTLRPPPLPRSRSFRPPPLPRSRSAAPPPVPFRSVPLPPATGSRTLEKPEEIIVASYGSMPEEESSGGLPAIAGPQNDFAPQLVSHPSELPAQPNTFESSPLARQQQAFLSGQQVTSIEPGTIAKGRIETNAIVSDHPTQFLVQLTSPLTNSDGSVAISKHDRLVMQTTASLPNGYVQASAIALMTDLQQVPLPPGAIQVVARNGKPLKARSSRRRGFGQIAGTFLVGALNQSSGLLTQSNQSVVSGNGGFVFNSNRPDTSLTTVGAAVIQGGTQSTLNTIERDLQTQQQQNTNGPVYLLSAGKKVQLQVTQPVTISR